MSFYYAEGMSLETPTQVGRRLRAIRQREAEWDPHWCYAPPRPLQPPRKPESLAATIAFAVGVLTTGPAVVIATVALYRALAWNTHRTLRAVTVETRSGHDVRTYVVPAGTPGVIEWCGYIGGEPCVVFRCPLMEANLIGRGALEVERIPETT